MTESAVTPKEKRTKIGALIVVGRQMANICFNLSQGIKLSEAHRTAGTLPGMGPGTWNMRLRSNASRQNSSAESVQKLETAGRAEG